MLPRSKTDLGTGPQSARNVMYIPQTHAGSVRASGMLTGTASPIGDPVSTSQMNREQSVIGPTGIVNPLTVTSKPSKTG